MNLKNVSRVLLEFTFIVTLAGCQSKPKVEKEIGKYHFLKYSDYKGNLDLGPMPKEKEYQELLVITDRNGDIVNFKGDSPSAFSSPEIIELVKLMSSNDKTKLYVLKQNGDLQIWSPAE